MIVREEAQGRLTLAIYVRLFCTVELGWELGRQITPDQIRGPRFPARGERCAVPRTGGRARACAYFWPDFDCIA